MQFPDGSPLADTFAVSNSPSGLCLVAIYNSYITIFMCYNCSTMIPYHQARAVSAHQTGRNQLTSDGFAKCQELSSP